MLIVHKPENVDISSKVLSDILTVNTVWGAVTATKGKKLFTIRSNGLEMSASLKKLAGTLNALKRKDSYFFFQEKNSYTKILANEQPIRLGSTGCCLMLDGSLRISPKRGYSSARLLAATITPILEADSDLVFNIGFQRLVKSYIGDAFLLLITPEGVVELGNRTWTKFDDLEFSNTVNWSAWYEND